MALFERNNTASYDLYIQQELKKHGHEGEKVIARAMATFPVKSSQWLLLGGAAAGTAQTCVIAVTDQTLLITLTKQTLIETPKVMQSSVFPLEKVQLLEAKKGLFGNYLSLKIDGKATKLHLAKISKWTDFAAFESLLSQQKPAATT